MDWIGLSSVLRPRQHSIGYMGDGFYRSRDPTNSIKVLKGQITNSTQTNQTYKKQTRIQNTASPLVYNNMGWLWGRLSQRAGLPGLNGGGAARNPQEDVYEKSITKINDLDLCKGRLRSREPLRHIHHWISRKPLETEHCFQQTTNRKWRMGNQMVMCDRWRRYIT